MVFEHNNYRSYLKSVYADRALKNQSYSLRAYAKQVDLNHTTLVQVLKGDRNLSTDRAHSVAQKLGLSGGQIEYFILLVQFETAKNPEAKASIQEKLNQYTTRTKSYDLTVDHFKMISDWYHFPIMQFIYLKGTKFTPKNISERLGISSVEAEAAIERLLRLELIEETSPGLYKRTHNRLLMSSKLPAEALKKFHSQMLHKAIGALETETNKERINGSETIAFSKSDLPKANQIIEACYEQILALAEKSDQKTDIYHLCINFFNLTKKEKSK